MTENHFEDLVNLYLDNEIGRHELDELKSAVRDNLVWRRKFERACQLHQAARQALVKRADEKGAATTGNARSSRRSSTPKSLPLDELQKRTRLNASVPILAQRQEKTGAAVSLNQAKSPSHHSADDADGETPARAATFSAMALVGWMVGGASILSLVLILFNEFGHPADQASYQPQTNNSPNFDVAGHGRDLAAQSVLSLDANGQPIPADNLVRRALLAGALPGDSVTKSQLRDLLAANPDAAANTTINQDYPGGGLHITQNIYITAVNLTIEAPDPTQWPKTLALPPSLTPPAPPPNPTPATTTNGGPQAVSLPPPQPPASNPALLGGANATTNFWPH